MRDEQPRALRPVLKLHLGDVLRLRKPHSCGAQDWEVVRLGADIGLRCCQCGHRILMSRSDLELKLTVFVSCTATSEPPCGLDGDEPRPG